MKILILIIFMAANSFAITRSDVERLLSHRNVSLKALEASGAQMLMGEVTGHGRAIPVEKIEAILTDNKAILRKDIEGLIPTGARSLNSVETIRSQGQYILTEDVRATILRP